MAVRGRACWHRHDPRVVSRHTSPTHWRAPSPGCRRIAIESKFLREIDSLESSLHQRDDEIAVLTEMTINSIDRLFTSAQVPQQSPPFCFHWVGTALPLPKW